ncbi:MAG: hypothetical protein ABGY41_16850 [Candidatus Poribacteria bacterium]
MRTAATRSSHSTSTPIANRQDGGDFLGRFFGRWTVKNVAQIGFLTGDDTDGKDDGAAGPVQRVVIQQDGTVDFAGDTTVDGDVIIGGATPTNRPLMVQQNTGASAYFENTGDSAVRTFSDANRGDGDMLGRLHGRWDGADADRD